MKNILLSISTVLLFSVFKFSLATSVISYSSDANVSLMKGNHFSLVFQITDEKGKIKEYKDLSNLKYIDFKINGASWDNILKQLVVNRKIIRAQNGYIQISYAPINEKDNIKYDSIAIPKIEKIEIYNDLNFNKTDILQLKITYNNSKTLYYLGENCIKLLNDFEVLHSGYGLILNADGTYLTPNFTGNIDRGAANLTFYSPDFSYNCIKKYEYKNNFTFDYSAANDKKLALINLGKDGQAGKNVTVYFRDLGGNLFECKIFTKEDTSVFVFNPINSQIKIISNGSDGKKGISGNNASNEKLKILLNNPKLNDSHGYYGQQGGNGGNGGDITIYYCASFKQFIDKIETETKGGKGGKGGNAGYYTNSIGGTHSGEKGYNGANGEGGFVKFIPWQP